MVYCKLIISVPAFLFDFGVLARPSERPFILLYTCRSREIQHIKHNFTSLIPLIPQILSNEFPQAFKAVGHRRLTESWIQTETAQRAPVIYSFAEQF